MDLPTSIIHIHIPMITSLSLISSFPTLQSSAILPYSCHNNSCGLPDSELDLDDRSMATNVMFMGGGDVQQCLIRLPLSKSGLSWHSKCALRKGELEVGGLVHYPFPGDDF